MLLAVGYSGKGIALYTIIDRRTTNFERLPETTERAEREYFPKLQAAPGFSGFYLVADEGSDLFVGTTVWESKPYADAFEATMTGWLQALEELGHNGQTENRGEALIELQHQR
jgi:heme-degrading monooxygenase HmoA